MEKPTDHHSQAVPEARILDVPLHGPVLIEANAGTGKTFTLVHLYLRVLLEKSLLPSQVLLLTFTNAATDELKLRLQGLLRRAHDALHARLQPNDTPRHNQATDQSEEIDATLDGILKQFASEKHLDWLKWCLVSFDQAAIFTINGFCQRVLQDFNHLCGSPVLEELETDSRQPLRAFLADYWRQQERTLDKHLLKFVHGTEIRLIPGGPYDRSDKVLLNLVGTKLNKSSFVDINQPEWPDTRALTECLQQLEVDWKENRDQLVDKITTAGISRVTPKMTASLKTALDNFFGQGVFDKKLLHFSARVAHKMKKGHEGNYPDDRFFIHFGQLLAGITQLTQAYRYQAYGFVQAQFEQWRQSRGRYRYSDQIDLVHQAVTANTPAARELRQKISQQWPVVLLDEFQDTDQRQFEIFESCYLRPSDTEQSLALVMVGDPKQAIYGFRGADVFVYQEARNRVRQWQEIVQADEPEPGREPEAGQGRQHRLTESPRLLSLTTNWRSSDQLISFVNCCFSSALPLDDKSSDPAPPFVLEHITYQDSRPPQNGEAPEALNDPLIQAPVVLLSQDTPPKKSNKTTQNKPAGAEIPPDAGNVETGSEDLSKASLDEFVLTEISRLLGEVRLPDKDKNKQACQNKEKGRQNNPPERAIKPEDMAILVANNHGCQEWYERLLKAGIPATLWSEQRVFDTAIAREVHDALCAILRPTPENVRALLLSSLCDFSLEEIATETPAVQHWHSHLVHLSSQWKSTGLASLVDGLREDSALPRGKSFIPWLQRSDGERRVTDFTHLIELLAEQETEGRQGEKLAQWLTGAIEETATDSPEAAKRRLESDEKGVSIITLHKAKGLQFPVVFMPDLEKLSLGKTSPLYKGIPSAVCHYHRQPQDRSGVSWQAVTNWQGDEDAIQTAFREDLSEKRRLLYVGMTRAMQRLYLTFVHPGSSNKTPVFKPYLSLLKSEAFAPWVNSDPALLEQVRENASRHSRHGADSPLGENPDVRKLSQRPFDALDALERVIQVSSFSGLVAGQGHAETDFNSEPLLEAPTDEEVLIADEFELGSTAGDEFLYFPKGPVAGNCFHEVMENCPLQAPEQLSEAAVQHALEKFGFATEDIIQPLNRPVNWARCLRQQAITVCQTPLNSDSLRLRDGDTHLAEMEFLLPARQLPAKAANRWLSKHRGQPVNALHHDAIQGFLGGYIDLVFSRNNRFYVVDYKTNHLGYAVDNYQPAALQWAIEQHHYDLQYLLYSAALLRLLQQRLKNFDYDRHFGGVYYLFVRGMGLDPSQPQSGVYFNKPEKALLDEILETLS